jgi:uncharacterized protein YukE
MLDFPDFWSVILPLLLVVGSLQVALLLCCCARTRRQRRALPREQSFGAIPADAPFDWLRWVGRESGGVASRAPRDEILGEFDRRQSSAFCFVCLARLGVMTPLMGLVLTAYLGSRLLGRLTPGPTDVSSKELFAAALPLVVGMASGPLLALVNQLFLTLVTVFNNSLRRRSLEWFDGAKAAAPAQADRPERGTGAAAGLNRAAAAILGSAKMLNDTCHHLGESASRVGALLVQLGDCQSRLVVQTTAASHCVSTADALAAGAKEVLERMAGATNGAAEQLAAAAAGLADEATGAFRDLGTAAARMTGVAESTERAAANWESVSASALDSLEKVKVVVTVMDDSDKALRETMHRFAEGGIRFSERTAKLCDAFEGTGQKLAAFQAPVSGLCDAVKELQPAVKLFDGAARSMAHCTDAMERAGRAAAAVDAVAARYLQDAEGVRTAVAAVQTQLEESAGTRAEVRKQVAGLAKTHRSLAESANGFQQAVSGAVGGLDQAARKLGDAVGESLPGALGRLAETSAALASLDETLERVARSTATLEGLPDVVERVKEQAELAAVALTSLQRLTPAVESFNEALGASERAMRKKNRGFWRRLFGRD